MKEANITDEPLTKGDLWNGEVDVVYDYGALNNTDKKLAQEFVNILEDRKGAPLQLIINELKTKFELGDIKYYKVEDTLWHEYTQDFPKKIEYHNQGFKEQKTKDGVLKIPHLAMSLDVDMWQELAQHIEKKVIEKLQRITMENQNATKD